jgi:hypothetical protein
MLIATRFLQQSLHNAQLVIAACFLSLSFNSSLASTELDLNGSHRAVVHIWKTLDQSLETVPPEAGSCGAKLVFSKIFQPFFREISKARKSVHWSGECKEGLAHGEGNLTLLLDGIVVHEQRFKFETGSVMHQGVPMSSLAPTDFGTMQSPCLDAGLQLKGDGSNTTFSKVPSKYALNIWTVAQDAVLMEVGTTCKRIFELKVLTRGDGKEILAVFYGKPQPVGSYMAAMGIQSNYLADSINVGLEKYRNESKIQKQKQVQKQSADLTKSRADAAKKILESGEPASNLADLMEYLGPIKSVSVLSKGLPIKITASDVSFREGKLIVISRSTPSSAKQAENKLQNESFNWANWFDVTLGGNNSMSRTITVICLFEPDVLSDAPQGEFVVQAKLVELGGQGVVLDCSI